MSLWILKNKVAYITGGSKRNRVNGTAKNYLPEGMKVAISGKNLKNGSRSLPCGL